MARYLIPNLHGSEVHNRRDQRFIFRLSVLTARSSRKKNRTSGTQGNLDETVLDILGRESANIEPVKVEDSNIVFGEEIIVTTTPSAEGKIIIILCK